MPGRCACSNSCHESNRHQGQLPQQAQSTTGSAISDDAARSIEAKGSSGGQAPRAGGGPRGDWRGDRRSGDRGGSEYARQAAARSSMLDGRMQAHSAQAQSYTLCQARATQAFLGRTPIVASPQPGNSVYYAAAPQRAGAGRPRPPSRNKQCSLMTLLEADAQPTPASSRRRQRRGAPRHHARSISSPARPI